MNIKKNHQEAIMRGNENTQEKGFNHFTLNTGRNLYQTMGNRALSPAVRSRLMELAQMALCPGGVTIVGNITFEADEDADGYAGTLFSNIGNDKIPLLTTLGAKTEEAAEDIWKVLQEKYSGDGLTGLGKTRPHAPLVVDILYGCLPDMAAFDFFVGGMSGDFCRCMGWAYLFPEVLDEGEATFPEEEYIEQEQSEGGMPGGCSEHQEGWTSDSQDLMDDLASRWNDFRKSMGMDISEKADRAEMMDEAVERMKMLGLAENAISDFRNSGRPSFGMENGQYFPLSDSEKAQIQKLEGNEEYLVYAVVRNDSSYGKMMNYIVASRHKCDWELDRMNLTERSFVMAYVYNCDFPGNSELGTIEVKRCPDGMLDRKMEQ